VSPLLLIEDLQVVFLTPHGSVRAVNGLSLQLGVGERVGLVGESGSGKSVTLLTILGLTPAPGRVIRGRILFRGMNLLEATPRQLRQIRGRHIAMIFQDPMTSLNPVFKVGEQVRESLRVHNYLAEGVLPGRRRNLERQRVLQLMAEVGIPSPEERYEAYPHEFSGGMQQRAMIAIALSCDPEIILADEPTTALDVTVQAQIMNLLDRINRTRGTAILLVTHDLHLAAEFCDRIVVMYAGQVVECGSSEEVLRHPKHPYTQGLLNALPEIHPQKAPLQPIPGEIDLAALPPGCPFAPRCNRVMPVCQNPPELLEPVPGHQVRCFLYGDTA